MKNTYYLTFQPKITNEPVISNLIRQTTLEVNILRAGIDARKGGFMVVELSGMNDSVEKGIRYLRQWQVEVDRISSRIEHDADNCVHCGACTAVCFSGALVMNGDCRLEFNPDKCIACGLCLKACPMKLFSSRF